jgi:hypothetical protein
MVTGCGVAPAAGSQSANGVPLSEPSKVMRLGRNLDAGGVDFGGDAAVEEEQLGAAVGDHRRQAVGRRGRRQRGDRDTGAQARQECRGIVQ